MSAPPIGPGATRRRSVLVVGGARGIGAGVAARFRAEGDAVVVADLQAATGAGPDEVEFVDVTDEASVEALFARHPHVEVVVNAAGVYPNVPVLEMSLAQWEEVLRINTTGSFLVGRAAARALTVPGRLGEGGRILFLSSGAATSARVGAAHYCASKAGLDMLMRVLALELAGTGVTVNAVAPGLIEVERIADLDPAYISALVDQLAVRRTGTPADVAEACFYLASDAASYVTGSVLTVDGGFGAGRALPLS